SLIPMMKLRLAAPEQLIDISRLKELNYVRVEADQVHIGAGTTHYDIESSLVIREHCPLLYETVLHIGDLQVRNRGTIGGSAAHADPGADYPAALFALEAKFKVAKKGGERIIGVDDFFVDMLTTSLEPGEVITEVIVPVEKQGTGVSYQKAYQPASGYAMVGVAVRAANDFVRVGVTGLASKAFRAHNVEASFASSRDAVHAAAVVAEGVDANSDLHASAPYRIQLAKTYTQRALAQAASRMT
ncbi:MAG: xanthine dehydrogenase family protein subunit M, partial [Acidobacteriaceae bacterium]|nr:xanthine dehydrogenase family protein subunit M [Acidobacteriaceae bacterium]